jgi:hypothetical protein
MTYKPSIREQLYDSYSTPSGYIDQVKMRHTQDKQHTKPDPNQIRQNAFEMDDIRKRELSDVNYYKTQHQALVKKLNAELLKIFND